MIIRARKVVREPALGEADPDLGRDLVGSADGGNVRAGGGECRLEACAGGAVVGLAGTGADAVVAWEGVRRTWRGEG